MKLIKTFENFSTEADFKYLITSWGREMRFKKELDLSDFKDIIYNMKDNFDLELIDRNPPTGHNWCSISWDNGCDRISIRFVFHSTFYLENKNEIDEGLEEFEDRLSDFEFNSGITTSIGPNTKAIVHKWDKIDSRSPEKQSYVGCCYYIEARFKV